MKKKEVSCSVETTLRVIGGRWKPMILNFLLDGPRRFGQLHRLLRGVSARTLAQQLRQLETDGIVHRKVFRQIPPKVEYSLTTLGDSLRPVLMAMHRWGETFAGKTDAEN